MANTRGRKPTNPDNQGCYIRVDTTPEQGRLIRRAAQLAGLPYGDFVLSLIDWDRLSSVVASSDKLVSKLSPSVVNRDSEHG
jgi:uncharacterized protein (DUF1778 family)